MFLRNPENIGMSIKISSSHNTYQENVDKMKEKHKI